MKACAACGKWASEWPMVFRNDLTCSVVCEEQAERGVAAAPGRPAVIEAAKSAGYSVRKHEKKKKAKH